MTLGSALFLLVFSAHVLGCFITIIMQSEPDNNWLLHYNAELANGDSWVRYLTAMYWATVTLTTMGYGDIVPVTNVERIYVIMVALVGAVIFSHCLGTISSLISQVAGVEDRVQAKLRSVQEYLQFRGIPTEVRRKVKAHYQHCWRRSAVPYDEQTILSELSGGLRSQVLRSIGGTVVLELPIFAGFEAECVGFLASRLQKMVFTEGEVIYQEGSDAAEMLIIVEGQVELQAERGWGRAGQRSLPVQRMSVVEAAMLDDQASGLGAEACVLKAGAICRFGSCWGVAGPGGIAFSAVGWSVASGVDSMMLQSLTSGTVGIVSAPMDCKRWMFDGAAMVCSSAGSAIGMGSDELACITGDSIAVAIARSIGKGCPADKTLSSMAEASRCSNA